MIRSTLSKIKKVCTLILTPAVYRNTRNASNRFPNRMKHFHASKNRLSSGIMSASKENSRYYQKTQIRETSKDSKDNCEKCKKVIDLCFSPKKPLDEKMFQDEKLMQLHYKEQIAKISECQICKNIIIKAFGTECNNNPEMIAKLPNYSTNLATTAKEKEEKLVPKIETIEEAKLVEPEAKIEDTVVPPKILGGKLDTTTAFTNLTKKPFDITLKDDTVEKCTYQVSNVTNKPFDIFFNHSTDVIHDNLSYKEKYQGTGVSRLEPHLKKTIHDNQSDVSSQEQTDFNSPDIAKLKNEHAMNIFSYYSKDRIQRDQEVIPNTDTPLNEKLRIFKYTKDVSKDNEPGQEANISLDALSKKCLESPPNQIGARLIEELGQLGVPQDTEKEHLESPAMKGKIVEAELLKKEKIPEKKPEIDLATRVSERDPISSSISKLKSRTKIEMQCYKNDISCTDKSKVLEISEKTDKTKFDKNIFDTESTVNDCKQNIKITNGQNKSITFDEFHKINDNNAEYKENGRLLLSKKKEFAHVLASTAPNLNKTKESNLNRSQDLIKDGQIISSCARKVKQQNDNVNSNNKSEPREHLLVPNIMTPLHNKEDLISPTETKITLTIGPLPRLDEPNLSLTELLERVRKRNRILFFIDTQHQLSLSVKPETGKCGQTKPPACPPPAPKCPPPEPCPPPPCPPAKPPCPKPCKPACPPPCPTPACPPKKNPCQKFKKAPFLNKTNFDDTYFQNLSNRFLSQTIFCFVLNGPNESSKVNLTVNGILLLLKRLNQFFFTPSVKTKILESAVDIKSIQFFSLSELEKVGVARIRERTYDPWVPIPWIPVPKKGEKHPWVCPKEGCKHIPPPKLNPPCKENPCINFPHNYFPKRRFSALKFSTVKFGDKIYDMGYF